MRPATTAERCSNSFATVFFFQLLLLLALKRTALTSLGAGPTLCYQQLKLFIQNCYGASAKAFVLQQRLQT